MHACIYEVSVAHLQTLLVELRLQHLVCELHAPRCLLCRCLLQRGIKAGFALCRFLPRLRQGTFQLRHLETAGV